MNSISRMAALVATLAIGANAQGASVFLQTANDNQYSFAGPGAAFGDVVNTATRAVAHASAFEFKGGVAVTTVATANGSLYGGGAQGFADANFADSFRVGIRTPGLDDVGGITGFLLDVAMDASGSLSATTGANPDRDDGYRFSYAAATYSYDWNVGGFTGSYQTLLSKFYDGSVTSYTNDNSQAGITLFVSLNDVVNVSWRAHAEASVAANGFGAAEAAADYGHTLKWGGVTSFRAVDANGSEVALPQGFQLSLMSADGTFDYMNAAVNPYIDPVPEPGEWAMIAAGLGVVGCVARRRGRRDIACGEAA